MLVAREAGAIVTGNLGLGTLTPSATLDVAGRALFRNRVSVSNDRNTQKPLLLTVRAATFVPITGTVSVTTQEHCQPVRRFNIYNMLTGGVSTEVGIS
jgi:hypothetical protein